MLRALDIRDLLIIDHLELSFQPGLNVLTGETGAGKSILLDSLGFVLGWRGRAELVRRGAKQGEVVAEFQLPTTHSAHSVLQEAGLPPCEDGALILRRVNTAEGRKTAWVNDRRCSGEVLRELSGTLVELHGQHDDRGLLNPKGHRAILDVFADAGSFLAATRLAWSDMTRARKVVARTRAALDAVRVEEEFLRHAVAELDQLDPAPGEDADLDARRRQMQGAERIRSDVARAHGFLTDGAEGAMGEAQRWLESVSGSDAADLDAPLAALSRAMVELGEAQDGVGRVLEGLEFSPLELEHCEERLFAIRALARKYDVQADELSTYAETLRAKLASLDAGDKDLAEQEAAFAAAQSAYASAADDLTAVRKQRAADLDVAVMAELAPLKMERAVFETTFSAAEPGPEGQDEVAFTVATNPGAPAGALNKIASGGELSRFLLALKVCLHGDDSGQTLIFDEIDRGVGGATADAVGRRLSELAEGGQVLVVTHSPQVAAKGAYHWRVQKQVVDEMTLSTVVPLDRNARIDEIARMVSGDTITDEARAAALSLLTR